VHAPSQLACSHPEDYGGGLVAFAYGFTFQTGHWWPDRVLPALLGTGHEE